jgi:hypothetical protein
MRSVMDAEFCADIVNLTKSRALLSEGAIPYFQSQFARCFDLAHEPTLSRIVYGGKADELV